MESIRQIRVPQLVRIKPGALDRLGIYLQRAGYKRVWMLTSPLPEPIMEQSKKAVTPYVEDAQWLIIDGNSFEDVIKLFGQLPKKLDAIVGVGGGKALDSAKYLAFLARLPYIAVPTSLSNDGFCSPQSSLTMLANLQVAQQELNTDTTQQNPAASTTGQNKTLAEPCSARRRSLPAAMPQGVVLDVSVCLGAPKILWLSGVGDLVSKLTAVVDWKLAFHNNGETVDDLAALLSDATVKQFLSSPNFNTNGLTDLGTALMLNGIAMEICGSSRPTSGSEHLISHALDALSCRPRLHGLQVGMATYIISLLQERGANETINKLFEQTGFWEEIKKDPFLKTEWLQAVEQAPSIKNGFYTILSSRNCLPEVQKIIETDPALRGCFV